MTQPVLFVATPIHHRPEAAHANSVTALVVECLRRGIKLHRGGRDGDSLITRARNVAVADFLKTDATHLMFIDADIAFNPELVFRMLAKDCAVLACAYPAKRTYSPGEVSFVVRYVDNPLDAEDTIDGCISVKYSGTGFMLIKRAAIEHLIEAHPEWMYLSDNPDTPDEPQHAIFDCFINEERRYLSEDYAFCARWRALGERVWLMLDATLTHIGTREYSGNLFEALYQPPENRESADGRISAIERSHTGPAECSQ